MALAQITNPLADDNVQQTIKEQLNSIINQLKNTGLVIHVLQNKVVIAKEPEDEVFTIVDGEEALKFVNNPRYADKIICVDNQKFYCHSSYLVLRSEYFRALFQGDFKETQMDMVSIDLPTPGNFEPILQFLYTGIANENDAIFEEQEIFRAISNSDFLGIKELTTKAISVFAHKWRVLTKSTMFRRSVIDYTFLDSVLDYGTKNALFKNGEKLKLLVLWDEEGDECFTETNRLIVEHKCLEEATISDLEWGMKVNPELFSKIDSLVLKGVFNRALSDTQRAREENRQNEDKIRRLTQCVRVLRTQLDEVSCTRCRARLPRVALKTRTCVMMQHSGSYLVNQGWTCCGELLKKSRGCKPVSLSRHRIHSQ